MPPRDRKAWVPAKLARRVQDLRTSLWLQPVTLAVVGAGLGLVLPWLDARWGRAPSAGASGAISADGAADVLGVGATTLAALVAVGFSIATVTVQLAASQYTPRLLRRFMGDRTTKHVLGFFAASLTYVLVVLRSIRQTGADGEGFVPYVSVVIGILAVVSSVALLPVFLHHLTRSIEVATIVTRIAADTARQVEAMELDGITVERDVAAAREVVRCRHPGYLRILDVEALRAALPRACDRARVEVAVGEFVLPGAPLLSLWPGHLLDSASTRRIEDCFAFSRQRDIAQDVLFGVRQLVDIALRALSPGVNDVTTAVMALNELGVLAVGVVHAGAPATARWRVANANHPSLLVRTLSVEVFLRTAFDDVVLAGRDHPRVGARIIEILDHLLRTGAPADVTAVVQRALGRVRGAGEGPTPFVTDERRRRDRVSGRTSGGAHRDDSPTQ